MKRRNFLTAWLLAFLPLVVQAEGAANFPEKPVRIVVGFPAGQATDIIARLVSDKLGNRLGQPMIVENKPGAGGSVALANLAQQKSDGYTVSFANTGAVITNRFIQKNLPYRPDQLQPVALLGDIPLVLAVRGDSKINSLEDLVKEARANPGKLTYATPGTGTTSHLAMESLKQATNIDILHVPYTGSSRSLTDLVAGNVDVSFDTITTIQPFIANKRLKALAIGSAERVSLLPDVPTLAQAGYRNMIGAVWVGAFVPRGTPEPIVEKLQNEIAKVVKDPDIASRLANAGLYVRYADAAGFAAILEEDTRKIQKVVEFSGAKAD